MTNKEIQESIFKLRLRKWEVAQEIGITDATFSRWLRTPLRDDRKKRVTDAIAKLEAQIKAHA
ncbi:hypothetical protein [Lacticaseibacillus saniviri]